MKVILSRAYEQVLSFARLRSALENATSESEREDIAVELRLLKQQSIPVSVLSAIGEVQARHPRLLPLLIAAIVLKIAFR